MPFHQLYKLPVLFILLAMRVRLPHLAFILLLTGCASTQTAPRFSFAVTPHGLMRLDTETGETSGLLNGQWVPIEDARYSMSDLIRGGVSSH